MAQLPYDCSGIVSTADQTNATYLPLESLDAHVFIADVSARVFLKQLYSHNGSDLLPEAYYVFPVPARAAVCSFEMTTRNGVELKGVVKELSQAKEEYEEARSKGWFSGFLEQFRQDVFVVSIGSMPPNADVTVLISYVVNLWEDDQSSMVRFQLSSHVRARYGAPSNSALYHDKIHHALLKITVDIAMPGDILGVTSMNHNPFLDVPLPSNSSIPRPRNYARKRFTSPNLLDLQKDFLLIVYAFKLGRPRCLAEYLSHEENSLRGITGPTTALACAIFPRFDTRVQSTMQEYIFLLDRSGSMAGMGITMAKEALKLLLKQLPSTNAMFNIYSFAYVCSAHWYVSRPTTEANILEAINHVDALEAGGGTEMLGGLRNIFWTRRTRNPTCILVITDGNIYNVDQTVETVRSVVLKTPITAPLRVCTLGIGSGASTELCERLSLAGNGVHMMAVDGEPLAIEGLAYAMQSVQVEEMSFDWGGPSPSQALHRFPANSRLLVTIIIPGIQTPTEVTITLRLSDGTTIDNRVPVQTISHGPAGSLEELWGQTGVPPLIHTMSAHFLIQGVEWGDRYPLSRHAWAGLGPEARRDAIKRYIVQLGTQYQIASSQTAFVAIAAPTSEAGGKADKEAPQHLPETTHAKSSKTLVDSPATRQTPEGSKGTSLQDSQGKKDSVGGSSQKSGEKGSQNPTRQMPGAYRHSADTGTTASGCVFDLFAHEPLLASVPVQEVLCIPNAQGGSSMIFTAPPPPLQITIIAIAKSWLKSLRSFMFSKGAVGGSRRNVVHAGSAFPGSHNAPVPKEILEMAQLQSSSDGSFSCVSRELSSIVGVPEMELRDSAPPSMTYGESNESIWATAIAVAFCRKRLVPHVASWEDMAEKASRFGSRMCGGDDHFEAVVEEALTFFQGS